jgi:hypothetical protein
LFFQIDSYKLSLAVFGVFKSCHSEVIDKRSESRGRVYSGMTEQAQSSTHQRCV